MKFLVAILLTALLSVCQGRVHRKLSIALDAEWETWKSQYEKSYDSSVDEKLHRQIWEENFKYVQQHNIQYEAGKSSFKVSLNEFSDIKQASNEEQHHHSHYRRSSNKACKARTYKDVDVADLPDSVDWRTEGYVTDVKTQLPQQCLHSVYFAVTGALEGQWFKKNGQLLDLSEQNIADCCGAGQQQCNGATGVPCSIDEVYRWVRQKGLESRTDYPDTRAFQQCAFNPKKRVATCSGYQYIDSNEKSLQFAVATIGPISAAIDSSQPSFQAYSGGVYNEPKCSNTTTDRNLLIVGYGTDPVEGDYWIAKNSWGTSWGEKGYIRLSRNRDNQCGVANTATYPFFSCEDN